MDGEPREVENYEIPLEGPAPDRSATDASKPNKRSAAKGRRTGSADNRSSPDSPNVDGSGAGQRPILPAALGAVATESQRLLLRPKSTLRCDGASAIMSPEARERYYHVAANMPRHRNLRQLQHDAERGAAGLLVRCTECCLRDSDSAKCAAEITIMKPGDSVMLLQ